jgi:tetratricopeptide (TPR) repeat protein
VTLADVYGALGLYQKGDALIRRTLAVRHGEPATFARQLNALGESQFRLGDYDSAAASFRKAWANAGTAGPELRSRILVGLGLTLSTLEDYDAANRIFGQALRIDRARGVDGGNDVARDLEAIGSNFYFQGELDRARPLIIQALALRRRFEGPDSPSVSDNLNTLGEIAYTRHDLSEAERYFRSNVAVDKKVLGPDHPDFATTMNNLARVLIEERRFKDATPLLERAMAIGLRERGGSHAYMTFVFSNLAIARRHMGRTAEAEDLFDRAIAAARKNEHRTLGPSLADLAEVRCATGRSREGLAILDEAARVTRSDYPDTPWRSAWVENVKGECLLRSGRVEEGRKAIARSSPVISQSWPSGSLFAHEAQRRAKLAG